LTADLIINNTVTIAMKVSLSVLKTKQSIVIQLYKEK